MIIATLVLLVIGGCCFLARAIAGPSLADRIVAIDALIVTIVAAILVNSIRLDSTKFADVAVVVAFIGFVGTVAGARFIEREGG